MFALWFWWGRLRWATGRSVWKRFRQAWCLEMRLRYSCTSTVLDPGDAAVNTMIRVPVPMQPTLYGRRQICNPINRIISDSDNQNVSRRESDGIGAGGSTLAGVILGDLPEKVSLKLSLDSWEGGCRWKVYLAGGTTGLKPWDEKVFGMTKASKRQPLSQRLRLPAAEEVGVMGRHRVPLRLVLVCWETSRRKQLSLWAVQGAHAVDCVTFSHTWSSHS